MEERTIYDLKLHEDMFIQDNFEKNINVLRVAGGWIYTYFRLDQGQMNSVFIPYCNEFQT